MWKMVTKRTPFRKKAPASSGEGKEAPSNADTKSFEKKSAASLGPFSLDEFGQLRNLFA